MSLYSPPVNEGDPPVTARVHLAAELRKRRLLIARRACDEIRARIPGYGAIDDPAFIVDLVDVNAATIGRLASSFEHDEPASLEASRVLREAAARRAEASITLSDFLQAFRVTQEVVWAAVVQLVERGVVNPTTAVACAGYLMKYVDHVATHAAEAYLEGDRRDLARRERVAAGLLEDCLAGVPPTSPEREVMAGAAGLGPNRPCVVVVARGAPGVTDALDFAARRLVRAAGPLLSPLVVVRQGEIVIIASLEATTPDTFARGVERARHALADEGLPLAIGVSLPKPGSDRVAEGYHEARIGATHADQAGGMVCIGELRPFEYLVLRGVGDPVLRELVTPALAEFIEEEAAGDGALIATLEAYAAADLKPRVAAQRLGIHVNTMHYRLSRIAERTGVDARHVDGLMQMLTVVRGLTPIRLEQQAEPRPIFQRSENGSDALAEGLQEWS